MTLSGKWLLSYKAPSGENIEIDACVPGCVHTDLISAGLLRDIFYRDNSKYCQWIENCDISYQKTFFIKKLRKNAIIEFDGLDTYADIYLNGALLGKTDNMFISYAFAADGILKKGENTLKVDLRSPIKEVASMPLRPGSFTRERMRTRRIQCTYGWDWVERFVTMGIYRDVRLTYKGDNEISDFYLVTRSAKSDLARLYLKIDIDRPRPEKGSLSIFIFAPDGSCVFSEKRTAFTKTAELDITVSNPLLWYPNGYGDQPLYTLKLLCGKNKAEHKFGIRKVRITRKKDLPDSREEKLSRKLQSYPHISELDKNEITSEFIISVNGKKVFCQGANWVPCEPFPSYESDKKIKELLMLAKDGHINMLRVWGGGIFEKDIFYSECDRLGILVSQDFLMACGSYPEDDKYFIKQLNREAEYASKKLKNRTCLIYWTGDNENAARGNESSAAYTGYKSAHFGILPVLKKKDPYRYFFPSSPYGGYPFASATCGITHNTFYLGALFDWINKGDFGKYTEFLNTFLARFNAEQANMGLSFVSSMRKYLTEEDIFGDNTEMLLYHTKGNPALPFSLFSIAAKMAEGIFGSFTDGRDRAVKLQMLQAEWVRVSTELFRRNKWYSSGILYWMYNDCWPAASGWSLVDYYSMPKPGYYSFKRSAKPFIFSFEAESESIRLFGCNGSLKTKKGEGEIYLLNFKTNEKLYSKHFSFTAKANTSKELYRIPMSEIAPYLSKDTVLLCEEKGIKDGDRAIHIFGRYADLDINYNDITVSDLGNKIKVTANSFTPFALIDRDEILEENCFIMKKGETRTVKKMRKHL